MIKTFRGILADGGQDQIWLSTKKGKIGYKIVKFELMAARPMQIDSEHIVQVFKASQSNVPTGTSVTVDFSDNTVLAAGTLSNETTGNQYPVDMITIFDNEVFNQDIFVTHTDVSGAGACNYYIELETINLSDNATLVSTLSDVRLNPQVGA